MPIDRGRDMTNDTNVVLEDGGGADEVWCASVEALPDVLLLTANLVLPIEALGVSVAPGGGVFPYADSVSLLNLYPCLTVPLISPCISFTDTLDITTTGF